MAEKHIVRHWRGKRESYNFLKGVNRLDPWTRYSVVESGDTNTVTEYFGENIIALQTGQLLPVNDIVETLPPSNTAHPYDRYLVGADGLGYKVYEFQPRATTNGTVVEPQEVTDFDIRFGVRVISRGLKNYVYFDGHLITYDDVDCGLF